MMPRVKSIDFIRAICALGLILFHYASILQEQLPQYYAYKNGDYGQIIATMFFVISGGMLYLNHKNVPSTGRFYKKRFLALLPMFYLAYLIIYLRWAYMDGRLFFPNVFHDTQAYKFIYTILGMDGYFSFTQPNFYILGEWFLGAIIIMYLLYPIILSLMKLNDVILGLIILALYLWSTFAANPLFAENSFQNIFSCLISFYVGVFLFKYRQALLEDRLVMLLSVLIVILLFSFNVPFSASITSHLIGIGLFIGLYHLGNLICKVSIIDFVFSYLSRISYPIFLLHHII